MALHVGRSPGEPTRIEPEDARRFGIHNKNRKTGSILAFRRRRMTRNRGYSYRHVLDRSALGKTLLEYLAQCFAHSTGDEWLARIVAGEVLLDNRPARGDELLRLGSVLIWNRPGWIEPEAPRSYSCIYEIKLPNR